MKKSVDFHFEHPEDSPGYLLWQITMLWQRKMKKALDQLDLTHTQFVLLAALGWLEKKSQEVTQIDIARHSNTDRMMASKVLRTLEAKALITRREHPVDTRAKCITLSKKGLETLGKAIKIVENADLDFFAPLGKNADLFTMEMQHLIRENADDF
ncbi:MAG: MarR family transcriptional regulator [Saprospiraceae bacterium]|nr:MarR family transcriptional regulator [Saprospiraceae bacterium]